MGLRGPAPVPTEINRLRGFPGKRGEHKTEPKPEPFSAEPPAHLDASAREEWGRLVPILKRMKVLTEADYIALGNLCLAYSTMIEAQTKLTETGLLMKTGTGFIMQNPLVSIVRQNSDAVLKLLREFGLTPSSRTRVQTVGGEGKSASPWEDL